MNILLINTLYAPYKVGGAELSVQLIAEALVEKNHTVSVLTLAEEDHFYTINGVNVYCIGIRNLYWPFSEKKNLVLLKPFWYLLDIYNPLMNNKIRAVLEKTDPDVAHVNNLMGFSPQIWGFLKSNHIKVVHSLRDHYLLCPNTTMVKNGVSCTKQCITCKFYSKPKTKFTESVDAVVGVSIYILKKHLSHGFFKSTKFKKVIGNPVRHPKSVTFEKTVSKVVTLGFIGRLEQPKGIELILKSISKINRPDEIRLMIAGSGKSDYLQFLKENYSDQNIKFLGYVDSNEFYKNIDYLVVPSILAEPFGRVIVEANGFGVPVIGSSKGGIEELITNGENGYLFKPENPEELERILEQIINGDVIFDESKIMNWAKKFEANKIADKFENLYLKLIYND